MNGVLVVDKPEGPTSHDVVARVRRATGQRRIGHTGTLDPLATGALALVLGRATRLVQFLSSDRKEYIAHVRFGVASPTYDREGVDAAARAAADANMPGIDRTALDRALALYRGTFEQTPPAFSAKKVAGTRAYRLARAGEPAEVKPVRVTVDELTLIDCARNLAVLRLACSSGFYVRTLAHELGERLACGAHLEALRRTRAGEFALDDAVLLEEVERDPAVAERRLIPMDRLLPGLPAVVLTERGAERAAHGNTLSPQDIAHPLPAGTLPGAARGDSGEGTRIRLFDPQGVLVAIAQTRSAGFLHPAVVLV